MSRHRRKAGIFMKKWMVFFLTLWITVSLAACGGNGEPAETSVPGAESTADASQSESKAEPGKEGEEETKMTNGKILVAYFSATNRTEGVAKKLAEILDCDLYEIVPEEPYTDADLSYNDENSRSSMEMNDPAARPAISGAVEEMEQYDIVFIGYPIWWGDAPRIVSTFVESYDFSGKTIVPFCTSGSSGIGSSVANLAKSTDGAQWLAGQRFDGDSSREEIEQWVSGLGLGS